MRIHFDFVLTSEQLIKAVRRNNQRLTRALPAYWLIQLSSFALVAALVFLVFHTSDILQGRQAATIKPVSVAALVALAAFVLYSVLYFRGFNHALRNSSHFTGIATNLLLEDSGLRITNLHGESLIPWSGMVAVEEVGDVVLVLLDNIYFHPIPASAFASPEEKRAFVDHLREQIAGATEQGSGLTPAPVASQSFATADTEVTSAPLLATTLRSATKIFFANLAPAFKLLVFIRVPQERICVSWWQIPMFGLLSLLLSLLWAFSKLGLNGEFQWYALPLALFHLPLLLLAAICSAYALRRTDKTLLLIQTFLMISLALDLTMMAVWGVLTQPPALFFGSVFGTSVLSPPSLWLALACFTVAIRYTQPTWSRRVFTLGICTLFIAMPLGAIYRQFNLWDTPFDQKEAEWNRANSGLANEENFYNQPKVLARELAAVEAERKGVTDVFFIGMAGYGGQDVFMKEVDAVARLFRERFDAEGHTIRLVNNNKTLAGSPIASITSLQAAFQRVAQVMDKEEDILFLFLTSHGSENYHFSLDLWPLKFNELDPMRLRKLLDESGIKHRVVVVSACYSGGFINALKDDNTLVISASAPNKNSFGCGNENDWTYFGNAYFNEALRNTYSFTEAFNLAQPRIAAREKKEDFKPSDPQMALGTALRDKLAALELQLSAARQTADPALVTPAPSKPPDIVEQYVSLIYDPLIATQETESCVINMLRVGPESVLERNPNYFGGLNKTNAQWPQLMSAWNRYAEMYCAKVNDAEMIRQLHIKHLRASIPVQDLVPVLKFLHSENGKHWYPAERMVMRRLSAELTKIRLEVEAVESKTYGEEQARIYQAFVVETKARAKNPPATGVR